MGGTGAGSSTPAMEQRSADAQQPEPAAASQASSLETTLDSLVDDARAQWTELALERSHFRAYVVERVAAHPAVAGGGKTPAQVVATLRFGDLYLAFGCALGDEAALAAFERHYGADMDRLARKFASRLASADDLKQLLRERLFVSAGGRAPKIAAYNGFGSLRNWLRVTGLRTFINEIERHRAARRELPSLEQCLLAVPDGADLELSYLKDRYRAEFKQAFAEAVAALSSSDRNLLRLHTVTNLSIDQIAAIYQIHRSTVARRLVQARDALLRATRHHLARDRALRREEFESIMQLIESRLEVSLERVLQSGEYKTKP